MAKRTTDKSTLIDATWIEQVTSPDIGGRSLNKTIADIQEAMGLTDAEADIIALELAVDDIEADLKLPNLTPVQTAKGAETLKLGAVPTDGDVITINLVTYTFKDTLTPDPFAANEVLIGISAATASANLISAITLVGGNIGTEYSIGTVLNPDVTAADATTDVLFTAKISGVIGNYALVSDFASGSNLWTGDAISMTGGVDGTVADAGEIVYDADGIWVAKGATTTADSSNWETITWDV